MPSSMVFCFQVISLKLYLYWKGSQQCHFPIIEGAVLNESGFLAAPDFVFPNLFLLGELLQLIPQAQILYISGLQPFLYNRPLRKLFWKSPPIPIIFALSENI